MNAHIWITLIFFALCFGYFAGRWDEKYGMNKTPMYVVLALTVISMVIAITLKF